MTWMFIQHFLYVLFTDHTPSRPYLPVLVHHSISLWLHYCVVVPKNDSKEGITLFAHPVCSDRHSKVTAFQPMPMQSWVKPKLVVDWPSHKNPFNGKKQKTRLHKNHLQITLCDSPLSKRQSCAALRPCHVKWHCETSYSGKHQMSCMTV